MAYTIYKTNGQQLLTLLDGTLDSSRGVNLVGKNYINFGTAQNENFVRLLENFANDTAPAYPLIGQLWYDTTTTTLKYYDGTSFNVLSNSAVLSAGITAVNTALVANVANLSSYFSSNITTLKANAATQDTQITSLWANAAVQAQALNALGQIVTGSNVDISSLLDDVNARVDSTNANVDAVISELNTQTSRIDSVTTDVDDLNNVVAAQVAAQITQGASITALQHSVTGANAAIVTANLAMRSYVDATNATQASAISSLSSSVDGANASLAAFYSWANLNFGTSNYTNTEVALFLPTYTGNIGADNVIVDGGLFWSNGAAFASSDYSDTNTAAYLSGNVTTGNITTNGVFWANGQPFSSGGTPTRTTISATTANLAVNANANVTITGFKGYALYSVTTSAAAWVSVYSSNVARTADYTRLQSTDPSPGTGVLAEVITSGSSTQYFSPAVIGYSSESPPTESIQLKVANTGSSATPITVSLTLLQMES